MNRLQRRASIFRVADAFEKKLLQEVSRTIPPNVSMKLRRAFTAKGAPFFEFYQELRRRYIGVEDPEAPPVENLFAHYRSLVRQLARVKSPVDGKRLSPAVLNNLLESTDSLRGFFNRVQRNPHDKMAWKAISNTYGPTIIAVARDKGIYLSSRPKGPVRWMEFRPMKAEDVAEEKLKDYDPETYTAIKTNKKSLAAIEQEIYLTMEQAGFEPEKKVLSGIDFNAFLDSSTVTKLNFLRKEWKNQKLYVATEPVTGEQVVFDLQGRVFGLDEWIDKEYARIKAIKKSRNPKADPEKLRSLSDEQVDSLDTEINYTSLTDNTANAYKLTKIFATKKDDTGRSVIVAGRYKGIYLDDIVNDQGRMIEGTEWGFNSKAYQDKDGKWRGKPERIDPSDREPYVTVGEDGRFYMMVPGTHDFSLYRNMLHSSYPKSTRRKKGLPETTLSEEIPPPGLEVIKQQGSRKIGIAFTPENFGAIKETLGSMALSGAAFDKLTAYFKELSEAEQATAEENLGFYTTEKLGGFKDFVKLSTNQKKALAWLDANGDKGVVALDTGVGKCVRENTLISTTSGLVQIQNMNPGITEPDTWGPVKGWSVIVNGESLPVKNFYYGGEKPTKKITTRYNFGVEGSLIHPLLVRTAGGSLEWVKTPELEVGDYLCIERKEAAFPTEEPKLEIPTDGGWRNEYQLPNSMNPELARLLGYIVAEGWTNGERSFHISQCPETNPEVYQDMRNLLFSQFRWQDDSNGKNIQVCSTHLLSFLEKLGITGRLSKDKQVPLAVLCSTKESVRQFLRGYVDAECSIDPSRGIEFSSASEELSRTVQIMLLRFGIVSRRRPKIVKGYEHTYWVTHVYGEDARVFMQKIGLVSERKINALIPLLEKDGNSNQDVVPHMASLIQEMHEEIMSRWSENVSSFRERYGSSIHNTMNHVRFGRRNASYRFLREILAVSAQFGCADTKAHKKIQHIVDLDYFYDPIETVENNMAVVMDIEVDDPSHCFVGNGLLNHNSLTSIAAMQKFLRDGYAEPDAGTNGRFLFVCPTNLKGNVDAEIEKFLDGQSAASLRGRIDQMDYAEFARARSRGFWKRREAVTVLDKKGRTKVKKQWVTTDPWSADGYIAVFFDEAQEMRIPTRSKAKAAMSLNHPRKICLTASPLEKEPMDAYTLASICNNVNLGPGKENKEDRKKAKLFKQRYCEVIGGRIMGVKKDPLIQRELNTWVKRNIFYADKTEKGSFRTETFPKLVSRSQPITMAPEIEDAYREAAGEIQDVMKTLVVKFRDKGYLKTEDGKVKKYIPAEDKDVEKWVSARMRPLFKKLHELANHPDDVIPGLPNPKIEMSRDIVASKLENDVEERTVLFSDDAKLVEKTAQQLSKTLPGVHVAALSTKIKFFEGGAEMSEYKLKVPSGLFTKREQAEIDKLEEAGETVRNHQPMVKHKLPFRKNLYRKYPGRPVSGDNPETSKLHEWSVFVLRNIVSADPQMKTVTLLGTKYDTGQNLQAFSNVIHLDRDTWNSESMKQRTARCWRQGQQNAVEEITLDTRYSVVKDKFDMTLDEIRKYHQMLEGDLFDEIIKQSQLTELGKEWLEIDTKVSEFKKVDQQALELFTSPYLDTPAPKHNSPGIQDL